MSKFQPGPLPWRVLVLTIALLAPAFWNGGALPFQDSLSYIKGGPVALEKLGELTDRLLPKEVAPSGDAVAATQDGADNSNGDASKSISGMRSATYSVYMFLMGLLEPNGFMIVAGQAAMAALATVIFLRAFAPGLNAREFLAIVAVLTLVTSAPWYGSFAMPDILGAAAVMSMVLYFAYLDQLRVLEKAALAAVTAFAVTAHPSNVLLVAAIAGFGGLERLTRDFRAKRKFAWSTYCWAGAPLALGVGAILAISLVGFGEASVAPKRYPFALARSVTDGPAYWHLQKHCDTYNYAVCEVFDEIPRGVGEFLWEETGLRYKATPEQLDRIRAEEMIIVTRAAREYPLAQVRKALVNTFDQIIRVGIPGVRFGRQLKREDNGAWRITQSRGQDRNLAQPLETIQIIFIYISLGLFAYFLWRRRSVNSDQMRAMALIGAALLANAVICGVLSGPADRYQGRLIWMLPMIAAVLVAIDKPWDTGRGKGLSETSTQA